MIMDISLLVNSIRSGNWIPIPVILLCFGICSIVCFGIPRLLNRIIKSPIPSFLDDDKQEDVLRRWWSGFKYGAVVLRRLAVIIAVTLAIFSVLVFISAMIINRVANSPIFSPLLIDNIGKYIFHLGFFIFSSMVIFSFIFFVTLNSAEEERSIIWFWFHTERNR